MHTSRRCSEFNVEADEQTTLHSEMHKSANRCSVQLLQVANREKNHVNTVRFHEVRRRMCCRNHEVTSSKHSEVFLCACVHTGTFMPAQGGERCSTMHAAPTVSMPRVWMTTPVIYLLPMIAPNIRQHHALGTACECRCR
jgi:hypothetical protein